MVIDSRAVGIFFLGVAAITPTTSLADHPDPAAEKALESAARPPKADPGGGSHLGSKRPALAGEG